MAEFISVHYSIKQLQYEICVQSIRYVNLSCAQGKK